MAKKWTKAEREAASIAGKKRWAARKKQDVRFSTAPAPPSDGSANTYSGKRADLAIEIVSMLRGEAVASATLVRVVDRLLRP